MTIYNQRELFYFNLKWCQLWRKRFTIFLFLSYWYTFCITVLYYFYYYFFHIFSMSYVPCPHVDKGQTTHYFLKRAINLYICCLTYFIFTFFRCEKNDSVCFNHLYLWLLTILLMFSYWPWSTYISSLLACLAPWEIR